jgi:hypothetical protein
MLFGCSNGKWFKASCSILNIVSRVDIACHTTSVYHSFSCQYSMSYDISISLLKNNFCKTILVKALGKGELICKSRADDQSNMTTLLQESRSITHDHPKPSAVPCEYSEPKPCRGSTLRVLRPAPFSISFRNHLCKTKPTLG